METPFYNIFDNCFHNFISQFCGHVQSVFTYKRKLILDNIVTVAASHLNTYFDGKSGERDTTLMIFRPKFHDLRLVFFCQHVQI